jgi:hypothetical protein
MLFYQRSESDAYHQEMEDLRRKNQSLVKELERAKMQAEKPFEQQPLTVNFFVTNSCISLTKIN